MSAPGLDFASAMNSLTLLTRSDGCTTMTSSDLSSEATGTKSRMSLNGLFGTSVSVVVCVSSSEVVHGAATKAEAAGLALSPLVSGLLTTIERAHRLAGRCDLAVASARPAAHGLVQLVARGHHHEQIHVAVRAVRSLQDRAEQRQSADAVPAA